MINARYGLNLTLDDVMNHGIEILKAERSFNEAAGFTALDDRLPDYFKQKKVPPHNTVFDVPDEEMDALCIHSHSVCPQWNYTIHPRSKLRPT